MLGLIYHNIENRQKRFFFRARYLVLIYTPKEARSRIFVTGGSFFARQMLAKKKLFLGRPGCTCSPYSSGLPTYQR